MSSSRPSEVEPERGASRWRPRSLTTRLVLTSIALVAVVSVVVAAVSTVALRQFLYDRLDSQLVKVSDRLAITSGADGRQQYRSLCEVAADSARGGPPLLPGEPGSLTGSLDEDCNIVILATNGIDRDVVHSARAGLDDVAADGKPHTVDLDGLGDYRVIVTTDGVRTVVSGLPTADVDDTIARLVALGSAITVIGVVGAAGAGLLLVRRQLRPLREVAATARSVTEMPLASGEVDDIPRVPPDLSDPDTEVGQVSEALNSMIGHVETALTARHESEQQVRQFLADASHELRTPLTTIQGYAELTRRAEVGDVDLLQQAMGKVQTESMRMSALVEDMMLLARLDSGRPLTQHEVDVAHLVLEAVNDARVIDADRRWKVSVPDEPAVVAGDEQRLHQVISNLLTNARRHTPAGTTVKVTVSAGADSVQLEVHDDGPGLPTSLQGKEFERFTRGDSSRTRASGGAGLGLSIVQAIVEAHHGRVEVASSPGDTTFTVVLPSA